MKDMAEGKFKSAQAHMNTNDRGLARHAATCPEEVKGGNGRITGRGQKWMQQKYLECRGITPLDNYNQL